MKRLHHVSLLALASALSACSATPVAGTSPGVGTGKDDGLTVSGTCRVEQVPFAVGLDEGDPVHFLVPPMGKLESPLQLHDGSGLKTTTFDFCMTSTSTPVDGSPCRGLDAFTWGLDWIPAKLNAEGDAWQLTEPVGSGTPGWAILFFERSGNIYAWGWGSQLDLAWPHLVDVSGKPNSNLIRDEDIPPSAQLPVHTRGELHVPRGSTIDGLDFHAWVEHIGPGWTTPCFLPPTLEDPVDPRLFYSVPRPAKGTGDPGQGANVYWSEPSQFTDTTWFWSRRQLLCDQGIPGLPTYADIDALSYYQYPMAPGQQGVGPQPGLLIFSLTEDSFVDHDGSELLIEPGEPFYAVEVLEDSAGNLAYGEPHPIVTPKGRPIRDVVGPRSRGVCTIDPIFFQARQPEDQ
ncbi:MAG: hypothetical protein P1V81_13470 [Planctomycetota bacterium]|nr:hypothetical protein [Planctomycetota bacterium]